VRVLYSLLVGSFQLTLVASEKRVKVLPLVIERLFRVLSEKADESDAIFAKHVLSSFRARIDWGDPERRGRSPAKRNSFSVGQEQIVSAVAKGKPAICQGSRNSTGLELLGAGAERGNYPEAKLKARGRQARFACNRRKRSTLIARSELRRD
jgi:hypothetical protein